MSILACKRYKPVTLFILTGIKQAANLFGCNPEVVKGILLTRTVESATDTIKTSLSKSSVRI